MIITGLNTIECLNHVFNAGKIGQIFGCWYFSFKNSITSSGRPGINFKIIHERPNGVQLGWNITISGP